MSAESQAILLRDTTLREGIQVPGSSVSLDQKRRFVALLEETGVPEIEIGLPEGMDAAGELADFIAAGGYRIRPTALVPCYGNRWRRQVDLAGEHCIGRIDILAPVSDYLLKDGNHYGLTKDEILPRLEEVTAYARRRVGEVSVGLIDAARAPAVRVLELVGPLRSWGVSRLAVYDSVGTMLPSGMAGFIAQIKRAADLPILVHCHNDYGLATANSLAAVEGGASAVDVAVNGVGGRAGNAPLEEVALALENLCRRPTGIDTTRLRQLAEFVQDMTGLKNSPTKPIVGRYCFAHVSVMHIRCIAGENPAAFEPFDPAQVGTERTYDFSLPVDYRPALEPFLRKSGCRLDPGAVPALVAALRQDGNGRGLTEQDVLRRIRQFAAGKGP
jgi:isopropylmalate/homocitrate/citramalate synthase